MQTFNVETCEASILLSALANQNRLKIMLLLYTTERTVGELSQLVGLAQSPISQHLAKLRKVEMVASRRVGQSVYYRVKSDNAKRLLALLINMCPDPEACATGKSNLR